MGCNPRPLTSTEGGVDLAGSRLAHEPSRPPAHDMPTGAAGGASPHCGSRTNASPDDAWVRGHSSKRCGDRVLFASRSPTASELAARLLGAGASPRLSASHPPLADTAVGSQCSTEVMTMPLSPSSLEVLASPPISMGSSDSSSASTSLRLPPVAKINCNQWHTSDRDDSYGDSCVCSQR